MKRKHIQIGQKYKIITWKNKADYRPEHWNDSGRMDKWQGRVVTVKRIDDDINRIFIVEDKEDGPRLYGGDTFREGWVWKLEDFEPIDEWGIEKLWEDF
jgi:hypothetical protein